MQIVPTPDFAMFQKFQTTDCLHTMRGAGTEKKYRSEYTKILYFKRKILYIFTQTFLPVEGVPFPTCPPSLQPSLLHPPLCSRRISAMFTPMKVGILWLSATWIELALRYEGCHRRQIPIGYADGKRPA